MAASFTQTSADLTTAKSDLAARAARVAAAATVVANLSADAVGQETDSERYVRLRALLLSGLCGLDAEASVLSGEARRHADVIRADLRNLKAPGGLTLPIDPNWNC